MNKIIKELKEALNTDTETKAYDTQAEVVRVEGQTLWVHIPGGVDETPVKKTINAKAGDTVQVRVSGGSAWLVGNQSAPPTDDATAIIADRKASEVRGIALEAQQSAEMAGLKADDAYDLATTAKTSADGKNTLYYGASAPTGGTYKTGDTWFNSSEDNAIYMWNGSTWVKEELGEDAIANLSITNAKIANGTIQNGKIANLDAGKIASGDIDANRIKTNVVSAINATVNKIDAKNINASKITIGQSQVTNLTTDLSNRPTTTDMTSAINNAKQIKTNSASGSIATFTGSKYPAVEVVAQVDPIQDLNGYDAPWVGGAGKNKLGFTATTQTINGVTFTFNADGTITVNGTATGNITIELNPNANLPSNSYTLTASGFPSSISGGLYIENASGVRVLSGGSNTSGYNFTNSVGRVWMYFNSGQVFSNNTLSIMLRLASETDATYAPYENICPISGSTKVNTNVASGQLIDTTTNVSGAIDASGNEVSNSSFNRTALISITASTVFLDTSVGSGYTIRVHGYKNGTWVQQLQAISTTGSRLIKTISVPSTVNQIRISYPTVGVSNTFLYEGNTYTTPLPQTVYGGTLDVTKGMLTVDRVMVTLNTANMNNAEAYPGWANSGVRALVGAGLNKVVYNVTMNVGTVYGINTNGSSDVLFLPTTQYGKTQTEWKALAIDVQAIIELATPQTYSVSPQQIELLQGTNNLWTDCGDVNVTYAIISADAVEALNNPIDNSSKVATSYITQIDDGGIKVHDAGDTSSYSKIDSTGMQVYQNNTEVAKFGTSSRIGDASSDRIEISSAGIEMYVSSYPSPYKAFTLNDDELRFTTGHCLIDMGDEDGSISTSSSGGYAGIIMRTGDALPNGLILNSNNHVYCDDSFGPLVTSESTSTGYYLGWTQYRWRQLYAYSAENTVSDRKYKDVIGDIDFAKELIMGLEPVEFQWKDSDHKRSHMGFIAQDSAEVAKSIGKDLSFYEAHYQDGSDYHGEKADDKDLSWGMMYSELIAPLVKVVQQQQKEIEELKSIVEELAKEKK